MRDWVTEITERERPNQSQMGKSRKTLWQWTEGEQIANGREMSWLKTKGLISSPERRQKNQTGGWVETVSSYSLNIIKNKNKYIYLGASLIQFSWAEPLKPSPEPTPLLFKGVWLTAKPAPMKIGPYLVGSVDFSSTMNNPSGEGSMYMFEVYSDVKSIKRDQVELSLSESSTQ